MGRLIFSDGREHELDPEGPTTLGMSPDATIRLSGRDVSELHCVIRALKDGGFGLKDLGSASGTLVNGRTARAVRLRSGDEIRIGGATLSFDDETEDTTGTETPAADVEAPAEANGQEADLPPGTWLGGYEIKAVIGHGGMGTVYRAVQLSLHRDVALKVLRRELAEDPTFVKRFVSEARAAGRFNHPNVVQVFDVVESDGRPFYSMELLPGGSLEDRIRESGPLPIDEAVAATCDAARGLAYADQLGIVHRDIKPDNLMPTAQGTVKICDLGLATDPKAGKKGRILGTPHFLSPEQALSRRVDHRSDLYSLGCTFFRLVTGKNPYQRKTVREILKAHIDAPVPRVRELVPDVPEEIDEAVAKLMAKEPADRYEHAADLVADLEAWVEKRRHGKKLHVAVLVVLVLALAGGLGYLLLSDPGETVREVVREDPNAKRTAQQNKELLADNALLKIDSSLPPLERAARLEAMAKAHAGTKAAGRATAEAEALREAEEQRLAAERARMAREAKLAERIAAETKALLDAGKPLEAWAMTVRLRGGGEPPAVVRDAVGAARASVLASMQSRGESALASLAKDAKAAGSDLADLEMSFRGKLALGDGPVPADVRDLMSGFLTRGAELLAKVAKERAAARAQRLAAAVAQRRSLLVGDGGALSLVRGGDLDGALARLGSVTPPSEFGAEWKPIDRMRRLLTAAKVGLDHVGAALARAPIDVTWLGEDLQLVRLDGGSAILDSDGEQKAVPLWDSPVLAMQVFGRARKEPESASARTARLSALVTSVLATGLPRALEFLDAVKEGKAEVEPDFPWAAVPALTAAALPDDLQIEASALVHLGRMLRAWQRGAEQAATYHADVLEQTAPDSIVGVALGITAPKTGEDGNGR